MDWPISPAGRQIVTAALAGEAAAARRLAPLTVVDCLGVCAEVARVGGRPAFKQLTQAFWSAPPPGAGLSRAAFAVRVAESGYVPADEAVGLESLDYQFARQFVLKVRDEPAVLTALGWPPDPRGVASTRPFYPDVLRGTNAWRQRIVAAAAAHRDKGPVSPQQWALMSLGGFYGLSAARSATRAATPAAGSVAFARAILHAAGCNVIRPGISLSAATVGGLFTVLPREVFGYTPASMMDLGVRPEVGDIFHVQGQDYEDRDGNRTIESTHLGVILGVWGNIWLTAEGGGTDSVTRQRTRELVPVTSALGKWAFKYDEAAAQVGPRPLQGWYSVSKFRPDLWMSTLPDAAYDLG